LVLNKEQPLESKKSVNITVNNFIILIFTINIPCQVFYTFF
jgi:hypothetical protein